MCVRWSMLFRIHSIEVRYAIRASVQSTPNVSFILLLLGSAAAQCGGTERWAQDGTDPKVNQVNLSHTQDVSVQDLIAIAEPNLPSRDDNTTRVVPDETHRE